MRPTDCDDFSTAIVCALPLEVDAVLASFDEYYDEHSEKFTKKQGDLNVYYTGRIGAHNVVLCCLPAMGKVGAASVVSSLRISFTQINLVLVVGICGGSPSPEKKDEIYLGDVVIANELMEYDYGRQYPDGFQEKKTPLQLNRETQNILTSFDVKQTRNQLEKKLCEYLQKVQKTSSAAQHPTGRHDIVYRGTEIIRMRKQVKSPKVHIGPIASADTVMKSREHRDKVAREHGVIGFEMEGAGAWDGMGTYGCLIIKGVCDYADHHKDKLWQDYAAATGAAAAKAFLSYWPHLRKPSKGPTMIPVPIDPAFTGRESELQHLEDTIASGVRALALAGLGGIGKTQLAAQFARRRTKNNHSKSAVFWIQCTSIEAIQKGYADILRELKMDDTEPAEAESMVKAHLRDRDTAWLLVLDNVDELVIWEAIRNIVPNSDHGHVLATTRTLTVADRIASHHHILVEEPSHQDATEMLRRRLRNKSLLEDTDTIAALLNELAYLPLAITQAASYVNQFTNITLAKYLSDLRKQEADTVKLLSKDFGDPGNYGNVPNAVIKTWLVSFNQISKVNLSAAAYLKLMACFNRHDIPPETLPPLNSDTEDAEALGVLGSFSFITIHPITGYLTLHRLVQLSTRMWMRQNGEFEYCLWKAGNCLRDIFPTSTDSDNRPLWRKYLPHVIAIMNNDFGGMSGFLGLSTVAAHCLREDARYDEALKLFEIVLRIKKGLFGDRHPYTLSTQSHIAMTYQTQGQLDESAKLAGEVLKASEKVLGPDHHETLLSKIELSAAYIYQERWTEAETLGKEALEGLIRGFGASHPDTLTCLSLLSSNYKILGKKKEEEAIRIQVMNICEEAFGPSSIDTLESMVNLASIYQKQKKVSNAEALLTRVLKTGREHFGSEHPLILQAAKQLRQLGVNLGDPARAEELAEKAVPALTDLLGEQHPDTLFAMSDLALIHTRHGQLQKAEDLMKRVLEGWQKVRPVPLYIAHAMRHLGAIYKLQGRLEEANAMAKEAVAVEAKENLLGSTDPQVLENKFDWVCRSIGENGGGELERSIMKDIVADAERRFGQDHPTIEKYSSLYTEMQEKAAKASPSVEAARHRDKLTPKALFARARKIVRGSG